MGEGHRWFAALWDRASRMERRDQQRLRREVTKGVHGRVLELGFGVGSNWRYLPAGVTYVGIEPDRYMMARARRHAADEGREVELHQVGAERLPFADGSFDTVFATLTLCSVDDLPAALAEARRVLKSGGELRFWEHVRPRGQVPGRLFDLLTPAWRRAGAGCRLNRDIAGAIGAAGFVMVELVHERMGPLPTIRGVAVCRGV